MSETVIFSVKNGKLMVELLLDDERAFAEGVRAALKLMEHLSKGKREEAE